MFCPETNFIYVWLYIFHDCTRIIVWMTRRRLVERHFKLTLSGCVVSICCVGLMCFAINLIIVPGMFVCSSFLISACMFIVSTALLISSATVIVRAGRMLFSSVSAIAERRDMGRYEVPLSVTLLGFGIGTMLAKFHV